jgi:glycine/D-amino acid oxidase-like deaminating enzyme
MKTDIFIIGGEIMGCATAYYLAKKGLQVILLEKDVAIGLEASGRYIGTLPGVSNFHTASGFSGQDFCLGPIVEKNISMLITGREPDVSLDLFKPERFATLKEM